MAGPGLSWLGEGPYAGHWPFCLTFVRGAREGAVFAAFGADPDEAVPWRRGEPLPPALDAPDSPLPPALRGAVGPRVQVGRSGDWLFALEEVWPHQGTRPEVLRRVSVGAEAVVVYQDIGKLNHEFRYAADGRVVAALTTCVPPHWWGSDPQWLQPLAQELGLTAGSEPPEDLTELEAMLSLAEGVFGLSLEEADLHRPWPAARILPVLDELPRRLPPDHVFRFGDPVLELLIAHAGEEALMPVVASRIRRLMAATGLDTHHEFTGALRAALAGTLWQGADEDPVGVLLRRVALDKWQAGEAFAMGNAPPRPVPESELRRRVQRGDVAQLLRLVLVGRRPKQVLDAEFQLQRVWDSKNWQRAGAWRPQALADLAHVPVPADELRAAEESWQAEPEAVRGRVGLIDAEPVRRHVLGLIAAGMEPSRIAALTDMMLTPVGIDLLLRGGIQTLDVATARRVLTIRPPGDD